jgi:single stranded DNA-binding protein
MPHVQVIQRHAHLAADVQLDFVQGREGRIARAVLTAISNSVRGTGETREVEATPIQWTVWGQQAENAAQYLGKGSHVNVVGRLRQHAYEKDGQTVYGLTFTAEEIDYLDSRAEAEARRAATTPRAPRPAAAA